MKKGSPQVEPRTAQPERIPNRKPSVKTLLKPYPVNESKVGAVIRRGSNFHSPKQIIPLQLGIYENLFVYSLFAEIPQGMPCKFTWQPVILRDLLFHITLGTP